MALFYGGAVPLHRQLKGLLLPGLPRGRIPVRELGGGALALPLGSRLPYLSGGGFVEAISNPIRQGPGVVLRGSLVQLPLLLGQAQVKA